MSFNFEIIQDYWLYIIEGIIPILILSSVAALLGFVVGLSTVFLRRRSKILNGLISAYIDLFRGTPVYVQLYLVYYGIPSLFPMIGTEKWFCAIFVFSLNSGAYLSEIMRAGIEAINQGQIEAAKALGVNSKDIALDIIIPQAIRNVLPAVINEFITLTKETAVVSFMGINDMMYRFQAVKNGSWAAFEPIIVVFFAYYILNKVLSLIGKKIERKLQYD